MRQNERFDVALNGAANVCRGKQAAIRNLARGAQKRLASALLGCQQEKRKRSCERHGWIRPAPLLSQAEPCGWS